MQLIMTLSRQTHRHTGSRTAEELNADVMAKHTPLYRRYDDEWESYGMGAFRKKGDIIYLSYQQTTIAEGFNWKEE